MTVVLPDSPPMWPPISLAWITTKNSSWVSRSMLGMAVRTTPKGETLGQGCLSPGRPHDEVPGPVLTRLGVHGEERQSIQHSVYQFGAVPIAGVIGVVSSHLDYGRPCGRRVG